MRRAFLVCLGVACVTWLEFELAPAHSYLEGETQIYVPALERLDTPGFLTRDLVATHPALTYTTYDEITLALHGLTHRDFQTVLSWQQLLCRAASIAGVYALALSGGVGRVSAFLLAAIVNLGAFLPGAGVFLVEREPVPRAFAFGFIVLALGLLSREKPLLAGFAGGVALLYYPPIAAVFWMVAIALFLIDKKSRSLLRPALIICFVFALLLANFTQLQPGIVEPQHLTGKITNEVARIQRYRVPSAWVSLWAPRQIWIYLGLWVCAVWATTRIWPALSRVSRYLFLIFPAIGILSIALSYVLLELGRWTIVPQVQPARLLLFTVLFASLSCGIAATRAIHAQRWIEAALWSVIVLVTVASDPVHRPHVTHKSEILDLAKWAETNTWGSSMFLFPDAEREKYPGVFRAASRRALYVDWESGSLAAIFPSVAAEWWSRWQQTMAGRFESSRIASMLSLPVDYYVVKREHQLPGATPIFANRAFIAYDANDLRNTNLSRSKRSD